MRRRMGCFWMLTLLLSVGRLPQELFAQKPGETTAFVHEVETELEYLGPLDKDRQIKTISLNILVPIHKDIADKSWGFYRGFTVTRPWGSINRTTIDPDSSAFGLGPVYLIRKKWWQQDQWQLVSDFCGGLIIYSDHFPAGGDIYNFMWRFGPKLIYRVSDKLSWNIGYKLMHVSNGQMTQRIPSHNPNYNAGGFSLSLNRRF